MDITLNRIKSIWAHQGFQKYFQNTGWMFLGRFFTLGISFFVGAYIARYLGPANYGLLSYVISFVGLFGFLASFGIDGIISREIIKNHERKDELIGTGFFLKLIGGVLAIITTITVGYFSTSDNFTFLLILLFSLSFIPQAFNIIEIYFQSQVLSKNVVRAQISATIIATILKILVVVLNKGIFWLTLIYIVEASLFALFLLITFKYYGHRFRNWQFNKKIATSILKDSWPLMLSTVAIGIYMKIDQVMIKHMLGNEQVGIYAVAVKLSEFWYFIPGVICTSLFPSIVKSLNTNTEFFESRMKRLYSLMFWMAFSIAVFMTIFASLIIRLLFGDIYINSVAVLQIYVWVGIPVFIGVSLGQFVILNNLSKILFYTTIFGALANIFLNLFLIKEYGIIGAATSTLVSYILATVAIIFFKNTKKQFFLILKSV
jgi:O-antigen/teichoic acid export membrane protein